MRFDASNADKYGAQGAAGFFKLENDHDTGHIRFLYNNIEDIQGDAVHEVKIDGKRRYVNCIRDYNEPKDVCPFCRENKPVVAKLFMPVYNVDEDKVQIWERGKTFFKKMSWLCSKYATKHDLVSYIFEVERFGKAQSTDTTYEISPVEDGLDDTTLEDLPEAPEVLGRIVLDKTAEEMEYFLQEGQFPPTGDEEDSYDEPVRRRESSRGRDVATRRTPSNTRRGSEDTF